MGSMPAPQIRPITSVHVSTKAMPYNHPHPSLEVTGGALHTFLPALKTLSRPYGPFPVIGWNCHVETIFAAFFRSLPDIKLKRECIRTKDDGSVALDWISGDHQLLPPDSPVLILMPGLTGGSEDSYVRHMLLRARSKGWRVVVFNSRGCGDSPVTTPQFYSASFLGDMQEVVAHVGSKYPKAHLYAVGWSLGANILVRYLGHESHSCPLSGAVSLCNPFNLVIADQDFRKGFNIVYDKALASALCRIFKKHALLFEDMGGEFNIPLAANAKSVRQFDDGLTRVSFGFKSVDDYYSNSSSSDSIKHVRIPLLCIQAQNDPIAPSRGIPCEDIKANPNCLLILTPKGGHLGWVAGPEAPFGSPWTDPVVMDFLEHLERASSNAFPCFSDLKDVQQISEGLNSLEV
ncbi:AB hydrolase-1 domain-containing protein [Citrus sinensis]|uniref:AB hydrolase-1 domain-containing protein n=1 Tax=Citrus sinensis TaxID=2711 RepID=A0ACB8LNK1_CITSI|nr:AB hydrolase-1 domain-containing protein [Citrus sinensis]